MKYFIRRELNEYGPYTLADLQRYVVQGNIVLTDLTRSEGMDEWVPVSQVIGNIPLSAAVPSGQGTGTVYAGANVYGGVSAGYGVAPAMTPLVGNDPPGLHWGWVLALGILTRWLFCIIWGFVQASWV